MNDESSQCWNPVKMGSLGGLTSWANTKDRTARTAPGRAALEARFLREAEGDPIRAAVIRKLFYKRLALKSVQARKARQSPGAKPS